MFQPRRAWPTILAKPKDTSLLYIWIALESLLMRPADGARSVWAVLRRGVPHVMAVIRIAAVQIAVVLIGAYVLALIVRLVFRKNNAKLPMGTYAAILPWLYAPKLLVTVGFSVLWAAQIAPDDFAAYTLTPWALGYHALSLAVVLLSLFVFFSTHSERFDWSIDEKQSRVAKPQLVIAPLVIVLACAAVAARAVYAPSTFRPIGVGDRAPSMTFNGINGGAITIDFPREKPVVIDFWATWCAPCVDALPQWARESQRSDADFISANVELDTLPQVRQFAAARQLAFAVHQADYATQGIFQVATLPTVIVLSKQGDIVEYWIGSHSERGLEEALTKAR